MPIKGIFHILAAVERQLASKTTPGGQTSFDMMSVCSLTQLGGRHWIVVGWVERSLHRGEAKSSQGIRKRAGCRPLISSCQTISTSGVVSSKEKIKSSWARCWEVIHSLGIGWQFQSGKLFSTVIFQFFSDFYCIPPLLTLEKCWQQTLSYENPMRIDYVAGALWVL